MIEYAVQVDEKPARKLFSLVVSVYGVEEYLPAFLESLLELEFDRNKLELIFVNDGSLDSSEAIIEEWLAESGTDAKLVRKENGGLSSARNFGMERATGEWISFPDPDDVLTPSYLNRVQDFLETYPDADHVAMLAGRLLQFSDDPSVLTSRHPLDFKFDGGTRVVNLNDSPKFVHLHSATGFYRLDVIRRSGLAFNTDVSPVFEDGVFSGEYMLCADEPVIAFLTDAEYLYRKRVDESSLTGTAWSKVGKFTNVFEYGYLGLFKRSGMPVPLWLQYLVFYDLQWYLKADERNKSETAGVAPEILDRFYELLHETLQYIDDDVFFTYMATGVPIRMRLAFISMKSGKLPKQQLRVIKLDASEQLLLVRYYSASPNLNERLRIDGVPDTPVYSKVRALNYFGRPWLWERDMWVSATKSFSLEIDGEYAEVVPGALPAPLYEGRPDSMWLHFTKRAMPSLMPPRRVLPVSTGKLPKPVKTVVDETVKPEAAQTLDRVKGDHKLPAKLPVTPKAAQPSPEAKQVATPARSSKTKPTPASGRSKFAKRAIRLAKNPSRIPSVAKRLTADLLNDSVTRSTKELSQSAPPKPTTSAPAKPATVDVRKLATSPQNVAKYKNAWALIDRDTMGQDNAEALYRFLQANRRDINAWFILRKDSADWSRLKEDGFKLVDYGSHDHVYLMRNAAFLLSSQVDEYILRPYDVKAYGGGRWKFVFLQHGVTHNDLSRWINSKPIRLMITATQNEHDSISGDGSPYVFSEKEVSLTGFPRHDTLLSKARRLPPRKRNTILIMPTWREHLFAPNATPGSSRELVSDFMDSEYVRNWFGLLKSEEILKAVAENDLKLVFAPHPNLQDHVDKSMLPDGVELVKYSENDVQEVIASARIMVTDYSSLAFEAAYVGSPVVYFQFDREKFFSGAHAFRRGTFSYESDGFGPVASDLDEAVRVVEGLATGRVPMSAEHRRRIDETFAFHDGRCSERVVAAVEAIGTRLG